MSDLLRVTVQLGKRRFDEDLAEQATITPNVESVNAALASNPSRFAEWAMVEALARGELDAIVSQIAELDTDVKDCEARVYLEIVDGTPELRAVPGWKPPTVDAIKARVTVDLRRAEMMARRRELEAARVSAKDNHEKVSVGRKTMEMKRDCALELARNWRQEMQTRLTVRDPEELARYRPGTKNPPPMSKRAVPSMTLKGAKTEG